MVYSQIDNELKNDIYKGLSKGKSFKELYTYLIKYHNTGGEAKKATIILTELRAVVTEESHDDILLELLDISTGWCTPHNKIWK